MLGGVFRSQVAARSELQPLLGNAERTSIATPHAALDMRTGAVEKRKEAKARSFAHALIAGVAKAPLKVTKKMGKKKVHFAGQILVQLVSMYMRWNSPIFE